LGSVKEIEKGEALMCSMGEKQLKKERKIIERDDDRVFICLISDLAKPFTLPGSWEPAIGSDAFVTSVLEALYRLQPRTSTNSCPFPIWMLRPTKPLAPSWLVRTGRERPSPAPALQYQTLLDAEKGETTHDKFPDNEANCDPFVEGTNFTKDRYSGRGELEADPPTVLDRWGNVQQ
jgi:hypothetical protein